MTYAERHKYNYRAPNPEGRTEGMHKGTAMPRSAVPKSHKILKFFEESSLELVEEILSLCAAKVRQRRQEGGPSQVAAPAKATRQYRKKKKQPPETAASTAE